MSETVETVQVVREDVPGGFMVINKEDYDPEVHTIYGAQPSGNTGAGLDSILKRSVGDIKVALEDMADEDLLALLDAEKAGKNRKGVVDAIDAEIKARG